MPKRFEPSKRRLNSEGKGSKVANNKQCRFLRVFVFFILFIVLTVVVYQRTHNKDLSLDSLQDTFSLFDLKLSQQLGNDSKLTVSSAGIIPLVAEGSSSTVIEKVIPNSNFNTAAKRDAIQTTTSLTESDSTRILVNQTLSRAQVSLDTVIAAGTSVIRWDLISNAEVHILHKLVSFLKKILNPSYDQQGGLTSLVKKGYQCSPLQAAQQELISKQISMDICSEIEWYKLVQLAWPDAKYFIDVGANKGYLGSLFLSLWGGGGLDVSPSHIYELARDQKSWKDSRNPGGYCKDGFNQAIQLHCPEGVIRGPKDLKCPSVNKDVRVISFDGSSYLTETLNSLLEQLMKTAAKRARTDDYASRRNTWRYLNYAVSNVKGTASFTKQDKNNNAGFEGGSIKAAHAAEGGRRLETEEVLMTTIDLFMQENGLKSLDVLKIDAEGQDNKVLEGAQQAIKERVGLFTFEGGKGVVFSKEMIEEYDKLGFSCYSTSRAGLFKWSGGCMDEKYMGPFKAKDKGNVFCVSRERAPTAALAFDALSFPVMIEQLLSSSENSNLRATNQVPPGKLKKMRELLSSLEEMKGKEKVDQSLLVPFYVNIKPFCQHWPGCAKA